MRLFKSLLMAFLTVGILTVFIGGMAVLLTFLESLELGLIGNIVTVLVLALVFFTIVNYAFYPGFSSSDDKNQQQKKQEK